MSAKLDDAATSGTERYGAAMTAGAEGPMHDGGRAFDGIDSPTMVVALGVVAVGFAIFGGVVALGQGAGAGIGPWIAALLCLAAVAFMIRSSRVVKPAIWREQLDALELRGKERALDVGCGRGLVAIELAKRLPKGEAVGIDIWRGRDQTGNTRANAERLIEAAGVADRVELVDSSMVDLPFGDAEFDVVTASLSLHCLPLAKDRGLAMHELMRVTKPGGRVVILDVGKTFEYQAWLNDADWEDVVRGRGIFTHYPPVRTVTARKPGRRR